MAPFDGITEATSPSSAPADDIAALSGPTGPSWWTPFLEDVRSLLDLREDWDSYGAPKIGLEASQVATHLVRMLAARLTSMPRPRVSPTARGGIELEWEQGDLVATIDIPSHASHVDVYASEGDRETEVERTSDLTPAFRTLRKIAAA